MWPTTSWFLPRSAVSSASCSATPAERAHRGSRARSSASERTSPCDAAPTMSRLAGMSCCDSDASSAGRRLRASSASSPLTLASSAFCADVAYTCVVRNAEHVRGRAAPGARSRASISSSVFRSSHRPSILLRMTMRPALVAGSSPARCWFHTSRSVLVTPASAARMNSSACALGSRLSVSSGSVPIAFRPGVSRITRPCCSSGCGKLMTACRQHGMSTLPSSPCSSAARMSSSPSP